MQSGNIINGTCWLLYFDILGFERQVQNHLQSYGKDGLEFLVDYYHTEILNEIESKLRAKSPFRAGEFHYAHFSDTFIFFTPDESIDSYLMLEQVGRHFFVEMLWKGIPLTGAMTIGEFYSDTARGIYVGKALIEGYKYADKQDWIGYILSPKVNELLCGSDLSLQRSIDYAECDVPIKIKENVEGTTRISTGNERLFACRIGKYPHVEESIEQMMQEAQNQSQGEQKKEIIRKYENTLKFIRKTRLQPFTCEEKKTNDDKR